MHYSIQNIILNIEMHFFFHNILMLTIKSKELKKKITILSAKILLKKLPYITFVHF